jgi:hypothetical protein
MTEAIVKIFKDGESFCALIGNDVMEGVTGFGDTVAEALEELASVVDEDGYSVFACVEIRGDVILIIAPVVRPGPDRPLSHIFAVDVKCISGIGGYAQGNVPAIVIEFAPEANERVSGGNRFRCPYPFTSPIHQ